MIIIFQLKVAILGYTPFSDITGGILCIVGIGRLIFGRLNWGFNIQNPTWKLDYRLDHPFSLDLSSIFCGKNQGNTLTIHQIRDIYIYCIYAMRDLSHFLVFCTLPRGVYPTASTWIQHGDGDFSLQKIHGNQNGHVYTYTIIYIYIHTVYIYIYICMYIHTYTWLVIWNIFYFPIYWE